MGEAIHTILVFAHIAGTILGVGGATLAEIFHVKALKDGKVDASEKVLMHANYKVIRIGLLLIILSGIALMWWWVYIGGSDWPLKSPKVWVKDIMVLVILANAILLTKHLIPMWLGASLSFTSWWGATILGVWRHVPFSFVEILTAYIVAVFVVAVILESIRRIYWKK